MNRIVLFTAAALCIASCADKVESSDLKAETSDTPTRLTKVSAVVAEKKVFEHYFEIQGAIEANKNIIVVPEAAGLITALRVQEGETIAAGETIAILDSKIVNASKRELQEQLDLAQYMFDKQQALFDQGIGTEVALKQAETQYEALKKSMNTMGAQESMYTLKAPFKGYIEEVYTTEGSMAGPTTPMVRLISLDKMSVKADISEVFVKSIDNNTTANLKFPAIDQEVNNVKVKRLGKLVNPANRTVVLEIEIPNPTNKMIPNMMSVIKLRDYYDTAAVIIPSRTILRDMNQKPYVFVLEGDKVVETKIETGQTSNGFTQVVAGVLANQKVVDKGSRGIKDQQRVIVK